MNKYYILGPRDALTDGYLHWSNNKEWTNIDNATPFPKTILHSPLPLGAWAIVEYSQDNILIELYERPLPPIGIQI